uniref:LEDGF domain-containing protein n=1 Tax=Heterorhabditis bacteriophora TaxID=37862 RepID=A0A1I7WVI7_HETBA
MSNIEKSLEGLTLEDQVTKLIKKLADSEELNSKLREKASQVCTTIRKIFKSMYKDSSFFIVISVIYKFRNVLVLTMAKKDLEDKAVVQDKKLAQLEQLCRALSSRQTASSDGPPPDEPS